MHAWAHFVVRITICKLRYSPMKASQESEDTRRRHIQYLSWNLRRDQHYYHSWLDTSTCPWTSSNVEQGTQNVLFSWWNRYSWPGVASSSVSFLVSFCSLFYLHPYLYLLYCVVPILVPVLRNPQNLYLYCVVPIPVPVLCIPGPSMSHDQWQTLQFTHSSLLSTVIRILHVWA